MPWQAPGQRRQEAKALGVMAMKHTEYLKDLNRSAGLTDNGKVRTNAQEGTRQKQRAWREATREAERVIAEHHRPKTRAECHSQPRPCPWVSCRYHLAIEVNAGSITHISDPEKMRDTCALDVADRGGHTLDQIGEIFGVTRERTRQIEEKALRKIKRLRVLGRVETRGLFVDHDNSKASHLIGQSGQIGDSDV